MRYRNREQSPDSNRPWRESNAYPEHDEDYGMRGYERRQYRGRESYEQQSRGGEGGRSGMWDHRFVPRDLDEPYRNNADEDRRGYQNIGRRSEFQSASGPDYGRYDRSNYGRYDYQRRLNQGPKGYKRSDERIREDVCDRLGHEWDLDASEVEVAVSNGEVTLTGSVSDRTQKFRIEHVADGVSGVGEVHNQIRVRRESAATQSGTSQSQSSAQSGRFTTNQNRSS